MKLVALVLLMRLGRRLEPIARLRLRLRNRLLHVQEVAADRRHLVAVLDHVVVQGTVGLVRVAQHVLDVVLVRAAVVVVGHGRGGYGALLYVLRWHLIFSLLNVVRHGAAQLAVIQATVPTYLHLFARIVFEIRYGRIALAIRGCDCDSSSAKTCSTIES